MNEEEKFYCWNCGKVEIPEPVGCCSGIDCDCMGLPIDPPFCSEDCHKAYYEKQQDEIETPLCPNCNGSGEGMHDGTKCSSCKGTGEEK